MYRTDVRAASGRLRAVSIPAWAQPSVRYQVAVVRASRSRAAARRYVGLLSTPRARRLLERRRLHRPVRRLAFTALLALALTVTAAFLLLPVLAIFLEVPPGRLLDQLEQ